MGFNSASERLMTAVLTIDLCCHKAASEPHAARVACRFKNNIQLAGVRCRLTANGALKYFRRKGDSKLKLIRCSFVFFLFSVALRPHAGHGLFILEVSRSHRATHHSR